LLAIAFVSLIGMLPLLPAARAGGKHCRVPRVAGLTVPDARHKLERAGCRLGARHPKHIGAKAVVFATSPQTGTVLPYRARVSVFLRIR
jgi:beta-lactam-binding protein with PASTA domain